MSDSLVVIPYTAELLAGFLRDQGIEPPEREGHPAAPAEVERVLREADWPFVHNGPSGADDGWAVMCEQREGRWPPLQEITQADDGVLGFRLGPLYGPFHVAREVSRTCGPQVAVESGGARAAVVTPDATYEEFHLALYETPAPADGEDREWSPPR
ncbi:hypothetical protein [Aeromicrobium flavum]|nr:hypothetical protein [Aeromicrobium flavum]